MKRRCCFLIIFSLLFLFITSTTRAELPTVKPEDVGLSSERFNRLGTSLKAHIEKGVMPGSVAMVARKGKIAYFESFGMRDPETSSPMQKDTIFEIHSMTKPIVSVGIMILQEQGRIFLGDPVSKYIPEFKEMKVGIEKTDPATGEKTFSEVPAESQITIHDLLRHTSGLTYSWMGKSKVNMMYEEAGLYNPDETLAEIVLKLSKLPLAFQPGTQWGYSRATDVLGRVIEIVSGKSLDKFLDENILKPLQMNKTGYFINPEDLDNVAKPGSKAQYPSNYPTSLPKLCLGNTGLVSTASDYMRFLQMLLNGGELDGVRILGRNTVEYMTANHLSSSLIDKGFLGEGTGFGLGFAVQELPGVVNLPGTVGQYYWAGMGGQFFIVDPREDLFAVHLANTKNFGIGVYLNRLFSVLLMQTIVD
jgi:CubicO group peptidase (beta-lactamase class C family)